MAEESSVNTADRLGSVSHPVCGKEDIPGAQSVIGIQEIRSESKDTEGDSADKNAEGSVEEWVRQGHEALFPGIPNDIVIEHILTKVEWKILCMLSTLSHGWRQAIQSRQVYRARIRTKSTRTLISTVHLTKDARGYVISLYDPASYRWILLPPIPNTRCGIPYGCGCVVVDGRLYVIGGLDDNPTPRNDVYMLDLGACKGVWHQCASMTRGREQFPCAVHDGKIYAFEQRVTSSGEVFDPATDMWTEFGETKSSVTDSSPPVWRTTTIVATVEGEIFVHANEVYQVYKPCKNQWREVRCPSHPDERHTLVELNGKLFDVLPSSVEAYMLSSNSWRCLQRISYHFVRCVKIIAVAPVDGELFALFSCLADGEFGEELLCASYRSTGFGRRDCNLVWSPLPCSFRFMGGDFNFLCPIHL